MGIELDRLPVEIEQGEFVTRYVEWGDMALRYARVPAGADMGPLLVGLPNDRCPSDHWGVVLTGSIKLTHADGSTEVASAGEAYYWPAGHTGVSDRGATFIEIGPVEDMRAFSENAKSKFA
jgi:hypothetical protein